MERMEICYITTITMTLAMKAKRLLEKNGIFATVSRLPPKLTTGGCAWGISIPCDRAYRAKQILTAADFAFGKVVYADGTPFYLQKGNGASPSGVTGMPSVNLPREGSGRR